jgi:integrase
MLTDRTIKAAKPLDKGYKLADIDGLYLYVAPSGSKSWRYNHTVSGKQTTKTYGRLEVLSLSDARRAHLLYQHSLKNGAPNTSPKLASVAADWLRIKLPTLSNPKHALQVAHTVELHVLSKIGNMPIDKIKRADLVAVMRDLDKLSIGETAHRVAGRIAAIFDFAIDSGHIESHPASGLRRVLSPKKAVEHMPSIEPKDAPALFKAINTYGETITRLALMFLAHTFVRVGEMTAMRWDELIDDVWVIPAERMKRRLPHVVPISNEAAKILDELRLINGDSEFVFASPVKPNQPISKETPLQALYSLGYRGRMTAHGFRALASTVLNSQSGFLPDVIERQLAHKETDAVRAAYHRAEYLDKRRELMSWWSQWIFCQFQIGRLQCL